jgi:hypothetical protein
MEPPAHADRKRYASQLALLGLAVFVPVLMRAEASPSWLPAWLGAALAVTALFGALIVFWRARALRLRYVALLAAALGVAAALGLGSWI